MWEWHCHTLYGQFYIANSLPLSYTLSSVGPDVCFILHNCGKHLSFVVSQKNKSYRNVIDHWIQTMICWMHAVCSEVSHWNWIELIQSSEETKSIQTKKFNQKAIFHFYLFFLFPLLFWNNNILICNDVQFSRWRCMSACGFFICYVYIFSLFHIRTRSQQHDTSQTYRMNNTTQSQRITY